MAAFLDQRALFLQQPRVFLTLKISLELTIDFVIFAAQEDVQSFPKREPSPVEFNQVDVQDETASPLRLSNFNVQQRFGKRKVRPNRLYFDENYVPYDQSSYSPIRRGKSSLKSSRARQPNTCTKCGRCFVHLRTLKRHLKYDCFKEPRFGCPHCDYKSKWKCNVQHHVRRKHKRCP